MMWLHSGTLRQSKNNQVANTILTPSQGEALQQTIAAQPSRVITSKPDGELRTYLVVPQKVPFAIVIKQAWANGLCGDG